jgi:hypothetical protein
MSATVSDPVLIEAFRRQARAVLDSGDELAFLGLWLAWENQPGVGRDDLVDVLKAEGTEAPL